MCAGGCGRERVFGRLQARGCVRGLFELFLHLTFCVGTGCWGVLGFFILFCVRDGVLGFLVFFSAPEITSEAFFCAPSSTFFTNVHTAKLRRWQVSHSALSFLLWFV